MARVVHCYYTPRAKYMIGNIGVYMMALTKGTIIPFHPEEEYFIDVLNGKQPPKNEYQSAWLRFIEEYSELRDD